MYKKKKRKIKGCDILKHTHKDPNWITLNLLNWRHIQKFSKHKYIVWANNLLNESNTCFSLFFFCYWEEEKFLVIHKKNIQKEKFTLALFAKMQNCWRADAPPWESASAITTCIFLFLFSFFLLLFLFFFKFLWKKKPPKNFKM